MRELISYSNELNHYSEREFKIAQEKLNKHMNQTNFFRKKQHDFKKGDVITKDLSTQNMRREYFMDCVFFNSNLSDMGMSGSMFKQVGFEDCIINNTKLDSCDFEDCNFKCAKLSEDNKLINLNLSKSNIINSSFVNCFLSRSNFADAVFIDTEFKNCTWQSLALENTIFKNTVFDSVKLRKLNFEFSEFDKIKMNNVTLPFPTIPFIFNGLQYIMNTSDNIFVTSTSNDDRKISIEEYLSFINELEVFYTKTENYFPLANIYIAFSNWDKAYSAIMLGIQQSIKLHSYRMIYYFCKLLYINNEFTKDQTFNTYKFITNNICSNGHHIFDEYKNNKYMQPIRNLLLNKGCAITTIDIQTNIESNDFRNLTIFLETIESIVEYTNKQYDKDVKYSIELRHNCPYTALIKLIGDPQTIILLSGAFHFVLTGTVYLIKKACDISNLYFESKKSILEAETAKVNLDTARIQNLEAQKRLDTANVEYQKQKAELDLLKQKTQHKAKNNQYSDKLKKFRETISDNSIKVESGYQSYTNSSLTEVTGENEFYFVNYNK